MKKVIHICKILILSNVTVLMAACDKKPDPIKTDNAEKVQAAQVTSTKSDNDVYIEKLNQDVKVANPDALLDEVNKEAIKN